MENEQKRCEVMTFFRSFYEAIKKIPETDRLSVYEAIFSYAFDNEEPVLTGTADAVFTLIKPVLNKSKHRAASGSKGGKQSAKNKQAESKTQANDEQSESNLQGIKDKGIRIKDKGLRIKDKDNDITENPQSSPCPYQKIQDLYNSICVSFRKIIRIDGKRKEAVQARWKAYEEDLSIFEMLFRIAESSDFLKGNVKHSTFKADFDWLMCPTNFQKVLEHKYDNQQEQYHSSVFDALSQMYESEEIK